MSTAGYGVANGTFFAWVDRTSTREQWQAAGQDRDGTFTAG
jgi:hypothetical protein